MPPRLLAMLLGLLTGMVLGAMLVAAICMSLERYAGVALGKEPLALIPMGMFVGGVIGCVVGRRHA